MKNIILLLLLLPLGLYSETIQLSSPQTGMSLNYSDFNQINLTCEFNQVNIDQIQQGYQIFNTVSVPRIHSSMAVGSPRLPVMRKVIEIPAGAQVEVEANAVVDQKLYITNMLYPVQPPLEKIQGNQPEFIINMDAYSQGNVYGEQPVIITDQGYIRGHHFVTVDIYPIRYQPDIGELEIRSRIEVNLYLTGSNPAVTAENYRKYNSQQTSAFMEEILVNANAYDFNENPQLPCGFLIIAPDAYISNLTDFVQWKREKGYQVTVTATSQTGTSTTQIKNYLQDAYDNWAVPPQFVIFVGDNNHIPGYTGQETNVISDHPYTQLDGTDLFPDIWLGRLSVSSSAELDSILDKILYYEQPDLWTAGNAWCKKAVFMASSDNHNVSEGSHRWVIQTYLGPDGYSCDSLWYYYGATTGQVSNAFNDGRSWGIYSGHGSTTSWADGPPFSQSNVNALTNEGMYPVVMSYACNTGQFSVSECFAETWIRAGNKGAVSFWGSSPSSYWTEDDTLERWVFQAIYDSSITWQKGFYDYGLFGVYTYGGTYASPQYYYEAYHLFGDPSMDAWTGYPQQAVVNYPSAIPIGSVNVQVNVSTSKAPVENALVAISDQDSLWTGYTNSTGVANIMVNTIQAGSLNVVVTAHNLQPHRGTIYITSNNAYVSYLMLNPTGGYNNGQINAGCNYDLEVYVKNWGNQTAHNCYGILSSTDPNINITEDSVYYGDINPSDSTSGNGLFAVDIASSIPDGYSIPCNLTITAAESTWVSNVGIAVSAPLLVLDAVGGPDQVLPGDNFELSMAYLNQGSGYGYNLEFTLRTDDAYVTVDDSTGQISQVDPGCSLFVQSPFHLSVSPSCPQPHFVELEVVVQAEGGYCFTDSFTMGVGAVMFAEDFESGDSLWSYSGSSSWHLTTHDSHSSTHSMYCGQENSWEYSNNITDSRTYTPQLTVGAGVEMSFWHRYDIETSWDGAQMQMSTDGGSTWTTMEPDEGYTGTNNYGYGGYSPGDPIWTGHDHDVWEQQHYTFTSGGDVNICWRFGSDGSVTYEGYYFDDVVIGVQSGFTGAEEEQNGPPSVNTYQFRLSPAYPNPVRSRAVISYSVGAEGPVSLKVYDLTGREITTLINQVQGPGNYRVEWDGRDSHGTMVSSGTYFYRMTAGSFSDGKKLVVVR